MKLLGAGPDRNPIFDAYIEESEHGQKCINPDHWTCDEIDQGYYAVSHAHGWTDQDLLAEAEWRESTSFRPEHFKEWREEREANAYFAGGYNSVVGTPVFDGQNDETDGGWV